MPVEINFNNSDPGITDLLKKAAPFAELTGKEIKSLARIIKMYSYTEGEVVVREGEAGTTAYIVAEGILHLEIMGQKLRDFTPGDFFGEIALIDTRPRMGTVWAAGKARLLCVDKADLENPKLLEAATVLKIYRGFSRLIASYMREGSDLYSQMDVLLIQEGGCAPGYNPVTAFISEYLEKIGRKVFICADGFRSLIEDKPQNYRRLVYDQSYYHKIEHLQGVIFSPPLRESRGADFRSERYPQFKEKENQQTAAQNIIGRKINVIVGIGGNGTFAGIHELSKLLPESVFTYFVPVTIDSDIWGTECIGEYTGVEVGSEKIRCYMADSRTHKRIYIIEMMGAHGGYHALHSCLGAGAHLAVVPFSDYDLKSIASALSRRENAVIVVAEGYKNDQRERENFKGNAAEYFYKELRSAGLKSAHRVICEPFSRDVRGAKPNNLDLMLAQRMARQLTELIQEKKTAHMPAVLSGREYSIPFSGIKTDNSVASNLIQLANRL
jgi:6-phosphofructokinase 1